MRRFRRWQRICILSVLSISVFAPIVLVSYRHKTLTIDGNKDFIEDLSTIKHRADALKLSAIEQETGEGVKEPNQEVYRDSNYSMITNSPNVDVKSKIISLERIVTDRDDKEENKQMQPKEVLLTNSAEEYLLNQRTVQHYPRVRSPHVTAIRHDQDSLSQKLIAQDEKVKKMKDQLVRAKVYLSFSVPTSNSHLVKELKQRIKELERALGEAKKDSSLSRRALQKMRNMEVTLSKASHVYPDCPAMVERLHAMTQNAEELVRAQREQSTFLTQLAGRTTPKGLHCLSMRLTAEYFTLDPVEQELPNQRNFNNPNLFHFAVFSDNVLACAVVVNSTVSNAKEQEKIVFHVVTDPLNFPGISRWFLLNPPGKATIQVQSIENFNWLSSKYSSRLEKQNSQDPRYSSPLNHLRFYLPDIFPHLDKIVFLDHDVVVQGDLAALWGVDMKGKVNGAVETCREGESSFRRMDMFINFSDPMVAARFDINACTWAFGMNLFDLREWRHQDLSRRHHRFLILGNERPLWKAGSLPQGWVTFYNQTIPLDLKWHVLGLGYGSDLRSDDIKAAAVIHYDGIMKPWLDIGIRKYKFYWNKYLDFDNPYLQRCNIHG
ncbi:hypothetical protein Nepgr_004213 [Nepenthes gracilis]|uniref:Hexosyltransferase n=1 Tax=Nepenthes gracilis TaxID=150966 RepID=A0AAD3S0Z8_NEPGR|nr:hypothetical protein Nepgr_004213 [Nepenthes gracilis]